MTITDSILLGILQGITEFLPISSSGHLTLIQHLIGAGDTPLIYDIFLHVASLTAILIFFRQRILSLVKSIFNKAMKNERIEILFLILSTIITVAMLPLTKPIVFYIKGNPSILLFSFLFTGLVLLIADKFLKRGNQRILVRLKDSIIVGIFQGLAVIPGISRSGSTIFAGLLSGLEGKKSVEYSFLLAIPAITGATILESGDISYMSIDVKVLTAGCIASFIFSFISLQFLVFLIKKTELKLFAIYLIMISAFIIYVYWL